MELGHTSTLESTYQLRVPNESSKSPRRSIKSHIEACLVKFEINGCRLPHFRSYLFET